MDRYSIKNFRFLFWRNFNFDYFLKIKGKSERFIINNVYFFLKKQNIEKTSKFLIINKT